MTGACDRQGWLTPAGVLLLALCGAAALAIALPAGPGVTDDSYFYLSGTLHLLEGSGYRYTLPCTGESLVLTHFPPVYPMLLALPGIAGVSPLTAAGWINVTLLAANATLVGLLLARLVPGSRLVPWLGTVLAVCSLTMLEIHSAVWSEPLFIALGMLGLAATGRHLTAPDLRMLILGALAVGLAAGTRYVGGAILVTGVLGILIWGQGQLARRIVHGMLFAVVAGAIPAMVLARNLIAGESATNRELALHPANAEHLEALVVTLASWIVPGADRLRLIPAQDLVLAVLVLAVVIAVTIGLRGLARRDRLPPVLALLALYVPIHVGLLLVSVSLFDPNTPLDNRMLSPVYLPSLVMVLAAGSDLYRQRRRQWLRAILRFGAVLVAVAYAGAALAALQYLGENGRGYLAPRWQYPEIWAGLQDLTLDTVVYTNYRIPVYLHTGLRSCRFATSPAAGEIVLPARARRELGTGAAVLVHFQDARRFVPRKSAAVMQRQVAADAIAEWAAGLGMVLMRRERNATLYGVVRRD